MASPELSTKPQAIFLPVTATSLIASTAAVNWQTTDANSTVAMNMFAPTIPKGDRRDSTATSAEISPLQ
jgi:hypothetical protein